MTMLQQIKSDPLSACLLTGRPHAWLGPFDIGVLKHFAQLLCTHPALLTAFRPASDLVLLSASQSAVCTPIVAHS